MREEIKRNGTPKDGLINEIIEAEWNMFDKVQNMGGRASCQDDEWTFYVMRFSQFTAFDIEILNSYKQDIFEAVKNDRNLVMEKYAYMMEFTEPEYFDRNLKSRLPKISLQKFNMVDRIANILIRCEQVFNLKYPALGGRGRAVLGNDGRDVSFHVYTIGELKTYSERTLNLYYQYLQKINAEVESENPSFKIHRATVEFYGYKSLDDAEFKIKGM